MSKRVILAKKVDRIEIEVRENWSLEQCETEARRLAETHNLPVDFMRDGKLHTVEPAIIEIQPYLPYLAPNESSSM